MLRLLVIGAVLASSSALATPIVYDFSGYLTRSNTSAPNDLGVGVGTPFSGQVLWDIAELACQPQNEVMKVCSGNGPPDWSVAFGGFTLTSISPLVEIREHSILLLQGSNTMTPLQYENLRTLPQSDTYLIFENYSGGSLFDLAVESIDLTAFGTVQFVENALLQPITQQADGYRWDFGGVATSFGSVSASAPEPNTLALLGLVVVGVAFFRARTGRLPGAT